MSDDGCNSDDVSFQIFLTNLSNTNPTLLNTGTVKQTTKVGHEDVFTIIDRSFRFEFPPGSPFRCSPTKGTPMKPTNYNILSPKAATPGKASPKATPKSGKGTPKRTPLKVLSPKVSVTSNIFFIFSLHEQNKGLHKNASDMML